MSWLVQRYQVSLTRIALVVLPTVLSSEAGIWSNVGGAVFSTDFIGSVSFQLAFHPNGTPFIAHDDSSHSKRLTVRKFDDTLIKWVVVGAPAISSREVFCMQLKFGSDGALYVAYTDGTINVDDTVKVKMFDGQSWILVGTGVDIPATSASQLELQFGHDGTPHIAYVTNERLEVKKLSGMSWVDVGPSSFSIGAVTKNPIQLAFDSAGNPYVAYRTRESKFTGAVQRLSGATWSGVGLSTLSVNTAYGLKMVFNAGGTTVYIAFRDNLNSNKLAVKKCVGSNWISVGSSSDFADGTAYDEFELGVWGQPLLAYPDGGQSNKLTVKKFARSSWSALGSPGFSSKVPSKLQLTFLSDGTAFISYKEEESGWSSRGVVQKWVSPSWVDISSGAFSVASIQFQFAVGPGGLPHAVYQDNDNSYKLTLRRFQTSCDASADPNHGTAAPCTYDLPVGRSCISTCNSGYWSSGNRICEAGILLKDTFICHPLPCNGTEAVANGISGPCPDVLISGQNCTPICNQGYSPSGVRKCTAGVTSGFQCLADACNASFPVVHGSTGSCGSYLASGDSCLPTCDANYKGVGVRKCFAGQVIDEFKCVPFPCDASATPENGKAFPCTDVLASDTACVPTCKQGWGPSGSRSCSLGKLVDTFKCIHAPCDASEPPQHGSAGNCTKELKSGGTCTPACDSASGLVPTGSRSCYMGVLTNLFDCVQPDLSTFVAPTTSPLPSLHGSSEKVPHRTVSKSCKFSLNVILLSLLLGIQTYVILDAALV